MRRFLYVIINIRDGAREGFLNFFEDKGKLGLKMNVSLLFFLFSSVYLLVSTAISIYCCKN